MYNKIVSSPIILTEEFVYSKIDQIDVYRYYLNIEPKTNKSFRSPFSRDSNPSLRFYVSNDFRLKFKDFSTGKNGDATTLVKELFNLDFKEALNKIYNDLQRGINVRSRGDTSFYSSIKDANFTVRTKSEIQVVLFSSEPVSFLDYWQSFYIDKPLLDLYDVKPAQEAYINGNLVGIYLDHNPIIRYLVDGEYKLYRPFAHKDKKEWKWFSTFHNKCIFGFKQLDFNLDKVIISKSAKDVLVWRLLGYNAITLPAETSRLWKELVDWLRSKFKYVFSCLDNDKAGITQMINYKNEWDIPYLLLPDLGVEYQCKDLAEIIYSIGYIETKVLINKILKHK